MFRLTCAHSLYSLEARSISEGSKITGKWQLATSKLVKAEKYMMKYIYICICQYDLYVYTVWYIVLPYAYCTHIHGSCILLFVDSCINACIFTHPFVRSFVSTCIHSLKHVWMSYASTYVTNKFLTYDWFEWIFGEITSDHRVWCESIKMKLNHTSTPYPMTKLRPFVMSLICDVMVTCCAFPRRWAHSLTPDYKL